MSDPHAADLKDMDILETALSTILSMEKQKITAWENEISKLPDGSLYLYVKEGRSYFKCREQKRTYGITRCTDLIYQLARKKYLSIRLQESRNAIAEFRRSGEALRLSSSTSKLEKLLKKYAAAGLDIFRITLSPEQYAWVHKDFFTNTMEFSGTPLETYSGIKVRSKSEQTIGNSLELRGIPYRYESRLSVDVSWMEGVTGAAQGRYKYYYPDFLIMTLSGKVIVWEHLGRTDLSVYRAHSMEKISAYRMNGICDEAHLILTFEKDLEKPETLDRLIARRILPYV